MRLILIGPPGAGKGTQAQRLADKLKLPHVATGDIFRRAISEETPMGKKAKAYLDGGELVPDEVTNGLIKERLQQEDVKEGFILDGYPRNLNQARALDEILDSLGLELDLALEIDLPDEEVINRLGGRRVCLECGATYHLSFQPPAVEGSCDSCGEQLVQREDDKEETILQRLKVYHQQTEPIIKYYRREGLLRAVDGKATIDEVFAQLLQMIRLYSGEKKEG